ncbi:DUF7933 domain-containing protein [Actinokineospora diospyrosa]|uniref:DUF7933 domain-containing protein n=1 Tax=Actinokineospora diospyrosa TaxID=103728 RepID=A0ABT1INH5_9PSEU|nr:hypothetical protein [Actinokineospora diospyrosa]MCP2274228.1 hypothetical protein [Actinokineospora diospyrosa]
MPNQRRVLSVLLGAATAAALVATAQPAHAAPQPGLSAAYSARAVAVGSTWSLVFTITNADTPTTVPFSFGVSLPGGVTSPGAPTTTCTATVGVSAPGEYAVAGVLAAAQPSCTITVRVTSATEANYATCADDVSDLVGLTAPPRCASISFVAAQAS